MALQVSPSTWRVCMEWVVRGALGGVALKQPPDVLIHFFASIINIRLFSGLGISTCLTSYTLSDTLSDALSFLLWNLALSGILFVFREESSVEFSPGFVKKLKPLLAL